jgi:HEAT repeat protein
VVSGLIRALEDAEWNVRGWAANALGQLLGQRIQTLTQESRLWVCSELSKTLGKESNEYRVISGKGLGTTDDFIWQALWDVTMPI